MVHGPKEKKERALGERLQVKGERCSSPKCALVRKPFRPGVHGHSRQRKALSEFGQQLKEKQKFKVYYGVGERELRRIFERAAEKKGSTSARLIELLERRLDNVIYRMGLAVSRSAAHQAITHGHILVNKRRVRSPGFLVSKGDEISIRPESKPQGVFKELSESLKKQEIPSWLSVDPLKVEGKVLEVPDDPALPFNVNFLIESFSK